MRKGRRGSSSSDRRRLEATLADLTRLMNVDAAAVLRPGHGGESSVVASTGVFARSTPSLLRRVAALARPLARGRTAVARSPERMRAAKPRLEGFAAAPIRVDGKWGGILAVGSRRARTFTREDVGYLELVARQIGLVFESEDSLERSRSRIHALSAFAEVAALVTESLDLSVVLREIAENAQRVVDASHASVLLADEDGTLRGAAASEPRNREFRRIVIGPHDRATAALARRERRTTIVRDTRNDSRVSPTLMRRFRTRAIVCTPLISSGRVLGVLNIVESRGPRNFSAEEVERIETFAHQAATAIERAAIHASLREQERDLRTLSERVMTAHESERRRIARELHDVVGQQIAAASLELAGAERENPGSRTRLAAAKRILRETASAARRLSAELHPAVVDDLGLVAALRWYCAEFERRARVTISFRGADAASVSDGAAFVLYRAAQEGLSNVLRHARARNVWVTLSAGPKRLSLELDDDGVGPAKVRPRRPGVGLLAIRERAAALGGTALLTSSPRGGARLTVTLPVALTRAA